MVGNVIICALSVDDWLYDMIREEWEIPEVKSSIQLLELEIDRY